MTMGHLGLIMLFCRANGFGWLKTSLAAIGRMAFTNYVVASIWLFQLIASPLWLSRFRFGPLEYVWRWLTYGQKPRMLGAASATE